jgi:predicted ATP-dependent serine protease
MTENGLKDVINPSELFLSENILKEPQEGSAVMITMEGSRVLLAEVQCLVGSTHYYNNLSGKAPSAKRASGGFSIQRLLLLSAVIEKRLQLPLWNRDLYLNIVGGLTISEPSADLAVLISIVSSLLSIAVQKGTAFIGEIGLGGELRNTKRIEQKILEAIKLGFQRVIIPKLSMKSVVMDSLKEKLLSLSTSKTATIPEIIPCENVLQAVEKGLMLQGKTLSQIKQEMKRKKNRSSSKNRRSDDPEGNTREEDIDESAFVDEDD